MPRCQGRYESAAEMYGQALEVARESRDRPSLAANMSLLAQTLRRLDHFEEALDQHQAALELHRELGGAGTYFVTALDAYGHTLQALGKDGEARTPGGKRPSSPRTKPTRGRRRRDHWLRA
jgi:tetratricopeptide (TPR) repeat protein